jgi:hypothetical protein
VDHYPTKNARFLNGNYSYLVGDEGLSRVAQGLISLTSALDVETESNVDRLCRIVQDQQAQLNELKTQVAALRKQLAQINRSTNHTLARTPTAK